MESIDTAWPAVDARFAPEGGAETGV
jgi:hypothetical protein